MLSLGRCSTLKMKIYTMSVGIAWTLLGILGHAEQSQPPQDKALIVAIQQGDDKKVQKLLRQGANPNARDETSQVPGRKPIREMPGGRVTQAILLPPYKPTALAIAARADRVSIVQALLKHGADVKLKDNRGNTALQVALSENKAETQTIALLLQYGAEVNLQNSRGHTPLISAIIHHKSEIVRLLLDKGAEVNATDREGRTPLMWAVSYPHPDLVKLLLQRGANLHLRSEHGNTALKTAQIYQQAENIQLLKKAGAKE